MVTEIKIPPILRIGGGSFAEAATLLVRLQCKRPLIVTDPFLMKNKLAEGLATQIRDTGLGCGIFHQTVADPTTVVVAEGVRVFVQGAHDSLVSLGGGSPIDTAKAIGMLAANGGKVRDYKAPNPIPAAGPVHVAIPTTAGTGSEVTRFTIIIDAETGEKMLLTGDALLPAAAVVDYELSLTMPARLTADTGTDSLTHAIEAFVSRKANPFTDTLALSAMKTIWRELPASVHGNLKAREAMMLAATQAGIAFSNASVALVHGMSRPLGGPFSYSPWALQCHVAAGSNGVLCGSCPGALCRMCAHHRRGAGPGHRSVGRRSNSFADCTAETPKCKYPRLSSSASRRSDTWP